MIDFVSDLINVAILLSLCSVKVSVCAGIDKCDGSNATDGLETHQLCQSEDDDNPPHGPPIQGGLPAALLPVSTHTHTLRSQGNCGSVVYCLCNCQN